ncbi:hypothetical protein C8J57DRAFT_1069776 [Mycena rebaudengoi]|nr:hypothetical protein C8J57DRAFT_1069776 [Mycena rebaudengoi]
MPFPVKLAVLDFNFGKHYNITDNDEWATLVPPHNGRIKLGIPPEEFDVGLYSDLTCLDTIRRAFLRLRDGAREQFVEAETCLGQMRQAIMCNSDLTLEPAYLVCDAQDNCTTAATGNHVPHQCRNWVQVREFVEVNQASWGVDNGNPWKQRSLFGAAV